MAKGSIPGAEFSRPVDCDRIGRKPERIDIEANDDERATLAQRLEIVAVERLSARVMLRRTPIGLIQLQAELTADVVQSCVVTLEPVATQVENTFELYFTEDKALAMDGEPDLPLEDELWPELIEGGRIDIGEAVTQQLSLAIDPYPRLPNARFDPPEDR